MNLGPLDGPFDNARGRTHDGDPWTAENAAAVVLGRSGNLRWRALEVLVAELPDGLTDFELGERLGTRETSAGTRRKELEEHDLVRATGSTRLSPSGNPAMVWAATELGKAALSDPKIPLTGEPARLPPVAKPMGRFREGEQLSTIGIPGGDCKVVVLRELDGGRKYDVRFPSGGTLILPADVLHRE